MLDGLKEQPGFFPPLPAGRQANAAILPFDRLRMSASSQGVFSVEAWQKRERRGAAYPSTPIESASRYLLASHRGQGAIRRPRCPVWAQHGEGRLGEVGRQEVEVPHEHGA